MVSHYSAATPFFISSFISWLRDNRARFYLIRKVNILATDSHLLFKAATQNDRTDNDGM